MCEVGSYSRHPLFSQSVRWRARPKMATPKMNRDWRQVRDRIKRAWSEVEFDDKKMKKARGSLRKMVNLIHARTEEPRADIRRKVVAVM